MISNCKPLVPIRCWSIFSSDGSFVAAWPLSRAFHVYTFPIPNYVSQATPIQNFERIRARWELTQPSEEQTEDMAGRRDKPAARQLMDGEQQPNGASKFRRKLSYGLAFISNPLSQRKTTPGRHAVRVSSPLVTAPATSDVKRTSGAIPDCDTSLSSVSANKSNVCSDDTPKETTTPAGSANSTRREDDDTTPRPLPRSRTLSFIPRPVSIQALAMNGNMKASVSSVAPAATTGLLLNGPPSKIPTPSPPPSERRDMSPRQHLSPHTSQTVKHIASAQAFEARCNGTVAKTAMRSRTTPNLMNVTNYNRPLSFTLPRKSASKKVAASPIAEEAVLQENAHDVRRIVQRRSHIQERPLRRESLAVLDALPNRRSFGPTVTGHSKQFEHATPPAERRRMSAIPAEQTPVTAKRIRPKGQENISDSSIVNVTSNAPFAQSRLMGPKDPPTPTPSIDFTGPALPFPTPHAEFQRKRLGTPNGLAGVWRSSRALAESNHEVRKLPRSSTFHSFGRKEAPPPLPPIPEQYRSASLAHITKYRYSHMTLDATRPESNMTDVPSSGTTSGLTEDKKYRFDTSSTLYSFPREQCDVPVPNLPNDRNIYVARPSGPAPRTPIGRQFPSSFDLNSYHSTGASRRPWSRMEQSDISNADNHGFLQVKDYMPPLYWAGRFQSRFDQWRTEAMTAQLDPSRVRNGPMSECNLEQESLASCCIFGQLRDLCMTDQAADSLWEFEYKYRKEHKLLGNPPNLPEMLPSRKQDDKTSTHQGAFGRAVRKLTPRKSSLINLRNLLKGKGKSDEARSDNVIDGKVDVLSGEF